MKTIPLSEPIQLRSAKDGKVVDSIDKVTFRKPRAGDLVAALDACGGDASRVGSMIRALAARCTGLSHAQFDDLSFEDATVLMETAGGFLGSGPGIGPMPSLSSSAPSGSPPAGSDGRPVSSAS